MSSVLDLADLAAEQWGLVTTAQAATVGASVQTVARLAAQGKLERVTHGVYRVAGSPPSPLDDLRAAWLTLEPSRRAGERLHDDVPVVASHRSAAQIHRLGNLNSDESEFTSSTRKQTRRPGVRLHRGLVEPGNWTVVDGLPVTTVIKTVADLAAEHVDGGHLAGVVRDAITRHHVDDRRLELALRPYSQRYGAPLGDGEALLARFLRESGVPAAVGRAADLAGVQAIDPATLQMLTNPAALARLSDQLAAIQRAIAPGARLGEQLADSPALKAAAAATSFEQTHSLSALARQQIALSESSVIKAAAELARSVQSPAFQQLAKRSAELSEMTRLARELTDSIAIAGLEPSPGHQGVDQ